MMLSIIIPCYNCENNIPLLMDTLCHQSLGEMEVILINDGSIDNTGEIIRKFILNNNLNNFKLYTTNNNGAAQSRQIGLDKASGKYVFFCDSDDIIADDFVDTILKQDCLDPDIIYFSSHIVSNNEVNGKISDKVKFDKDYFFFDADSFLRSQLKRGNWTSAVWTYVFRREIVKQSKAFFTMRKAHEDHLFTLRILAYAKRICILQKTLYIQKITIGSLTTSRKDREYIYERYKAFNESSADMRNFFSAATISLYDEWSIRSIISLCVSNPKISIYELLNKKTYFIFWSKKTIFIRLFFRIFFKKIKEFIKYKRN